MATQAASKAKVVEERERTIASVVRVDIVKPLGERTWDDVGPVLRKVRWAAARCLNAAMRACLIRDATKKDVASLTEAYRAVGEQVEREREYDPEISIASEIMVAWSKLAGDSYAAHRKKIWRGDESLPSYNKGAPIVVSAVGWDFERDGKGYVIETRLMAGRVGRVRFAVAADGGNAHARLRELADPAHPARHGDLKIMFDERKKKWFALLTIVRPKPEAPSLLASRKLAVHRGITTLLTYATSDGETGVLAEGGDVLAFKRQLHARRRSWYAHKRRMPARSRGRGTWLRYEQYRALDDKEARWVKTKLQQYAAATVKLAIQRGCGTIVVDDWSARMLALESDRAGKQYLALMIRNWPFAAQRDAIAWAAKKEGIAVETVASRHESLRCPACGNVDAGQDDGRGTFKCSNGACGIKRSVEEVAAWNQLAEADAGGGFEKNEAKRAAVRERVGGAKKPGGARKDEKSKEKQEVPPGPDVGDDDGKETE